jgi:DNA-binding response OmpR family regulator
MTRTVLSIEDNSGFQQMVHAALQQEGYRVVEAQGGSDGLELARTLQPDLILLDVMLMQGLDGLNVCRAITGDPRTGHIPVVMLSAIEDEAEVEAGLAAGAKGYLVRPFYPRELVALLNRLLSQNCGAKA